MSGLDNNGPLLGAAASISNGDVVDWSELRRRIADDIDTAILDELQVLAGVAQVHRNQWGALEILEPIGHGTFGTVYRAFDRDLQRHVALKVTRPVENGTPFDPERLVREAQRLARVKHPNVVAVYSAERKGDEVGVAMEWLKGQTLDAIVQTQGPLSPREVAVIGIDLCRAVAAVHAAGLLHGDIKANNVMREEGGRIVLMDFGASRDLSRAPAAGHDFAGTPLYIAPEVFAGAPRSTASDVYSLGVLLYYLSTGRYPVDGDTRSAIDRQHAQTSGRRHLRDVRPDLPDAFVQVVQRALADDPAGRYSTAGRLEDALRSLLAGEATTLSRPRRHRTLLLVAASLGLAIIAAALFSLLGADTGNKAAVAAARPPAVTTTVNRAAESYQVEAAFYRLDTTGPARLDAGGRVRPGDRLSLQVQTSVPTHVYVVNEDEQRHAYLLFPLSGFTEKNPVAAGRVHHLPGMRDGVDRYWQVDSPGKREHFLVFVSPAPLTEFESTFAQLPRASENNPVSSTAIGMSALNTLRGVGGVVAATTPRVGQPLYEQYPTPLPAGSETASGVWVRQLTVRSTP